MATLYAPVLRHLMVEVNDVVNRVDEIERRPVQTEGAGLRLGNVHERVQHREKPVALLDTVRERLAKICGGLIGAERHLRARPDSRHRSAQVVRDVVERGTHAVDQGRDPGHHAVEEHRQLVQLIGGAPCRHAHIHDAGLHAPHAVDELPERTEGANGHEAAAHGSEESDGNGHAGHDAPEASKDVVALRRALADLQHGAVREPAGYHVQSFAA